MLFLSSICFLNSVYFLVRWFAFFRLSFGALLWCSFIPQQYIFVLLHLPTNCIIVCSFSRCLFLINSFSSVCFFFLSLFSISLVISPSFYSILILTSLPLFSCFKRSSPFFYSLLCHLIFHHALNFLSFSCPNLLYIFSLIILYFSRCDDQHHTSMIRRLQQEGATIEHILRIMSGKMSTAICLR